MMSSSEVQRISLSATKIVTPTGMIDVEDWSAPVGGEADQEEEDEDGADRDGANRPEDAASEREIVGSVGKETSTIPDKSPRANARVLTNGTSEPRLSNGVGGNDEASPNKANETITSSIGDITIDSVRDHLNSTTTTLCSTTTEEIVGRCHWRR